MTAPTLPQTLAQALAPLHDVLKPDVPCALLDYPSYPNLGDHLIWLGSLLYLRDRHCRIVYTASALDFDADRLGRCLPAAAPILLNGGGNFGDLWPRYQKFREAIVARYPDRPIVVLPQTIFFADAANLQQAAAQFNRHPNLTLCVRDRHSLEIARAHFTSRLLLAPDMAFHLAGQPGLAPVAPTSDRLLYLCRQDRERPAGADAARLNLPNLTVADWPTFNWWLGPANQPQRQRLASLARNLWQRGLTTPREWQARQQWQRASQPDFRAIATPQRHSQSWSFIHAGIYQFQPYRALISNRLHGHILALLLDIPHVFLANSYHKNAAFYEAWTQHLPNCEFAASLTAVRPALARLGLEPS